MISRRDICLSFVSAGIASSSFTVHAQASVNAIAKSPLPSLKPVPRVTRRAAKLIAAAEAQIGETVRYDGAYVRLKYPMGDIPRRTGVCTDVVIRAYRDAFGVDLQKQIHEDMKQAFSAYPKIWGLKRPDKNIDHRRVPNMERFFARQEARLETGIEGSDFQPGDLVSHRLPGNRPHIGIVSEQLSRDRKRPLLIHNIGSGTKIEDRLFAFKIVGHFRYLPSET